MVTSSPIKSLPKRERLLLLSSPHVGSWPAYLLIAVPVVFVLVYALWPWFTISDSAVTAIVIIATTLFCVAVLTLLYLLIRVFVGLLRARYDIAQRYIGPLFLVLVLVLGIVFFSVVIMIVQPTFY